MWPRGTGLCLNRGHLSLLLCDAPGGERLSPLGVARVTVPLPGGTFGTRAGLAPAGSPVQRGLGRLLKIRQTSSETFQNHSFTRTVPQAEWPQGHGAGHSTLRQERPPFRAPRPQLAVGVCAVGLRQNHRSHRLELDLRDRFPHGETLGSPETRRHRGRGGGAEDVRFRPDLPAGGAAGAGARASPARRGSPPGSRSLPSCLSGAGAVGPRPRPCRPRRSAPHLEHGGFKVTAASPRVRTQAWLPRHLSRGVAGRRALCPPGTPVSVEGSERQRAGAPSSWHVPERNKYHKASKPIGPPRKSRHWTPWPLCLPGI